ncbi:beta-lactamase family protein [Chitinophaga pendula]|uniref:serine hydrolase domain-containing protein n=1 Tax=Chitinophaga TaxID=79328 RepID=UPI000BB085E1|nr:MULTISPECIES: serine hydrolase domain-containing protein [Chitinophaga]ASZ13062.1 serine hydrolase [Chitinophaga sp. MD30]UCJ09316.1 beta-lactamase family protein [Chitinophaga pendula]
MKRLKFITGIFAISAISFSVLTGCQSNAARKKAANKKKTDSVYTIGLTDQEKAAILNDPRTKRMQQDLATFYNTRLLRSGFNGAILVARKGVVIFEEYKGVENFKTKQPLTDSSSFQLASVSKTFTGMATLWLMEQQKLKLDDTIQQYFPDFPYMGITIRMLLNHRSGLPNYLYFCDSLVKDKKQFLTNEEIIRLMTAHKPPLAHQPGTHFQYCNTNYMLLAAIIEKVSGQPYATFMEQTFFAPLGMGNTFVYDPTRAPRPHQTVSHKYNGQAEPDTNLDGVEGDKGIYSTVQDMLKWDQALYSGKLLKPETLKEAYTPYSNEKPGIRNYGLGWRLMIYPDSTKIVYHNGWWRGNNTVFYRFIQDSSTLIILGNKYNRGIYQAVKPIHEIMGHGAGEEAGEE